MIVLGLFLIITFILSIFISIALLEQTRRRYDVIGKVNLNTTERLKHHTRNDRHTRDTKGYSVSVDLNEHLRCLDGEQAIRSTYGRKIVCADKRCINDPTYFEIEFSKNPIDLKILTRVPHLLKRCDSESYVLDFIRNEEPIYRIVKEYPFVVSSLCAEVVLPSHFYLSVWNEESGRRHVRTVVPESSDDLLPLCGQKGKDKLRVQIEIYESLLDFCRFSIHTHIRNKGVVCCKTLCSRPEPLTSIELSAIKRVAAQEPYYTCSWLEKRILFKWHVGKERFDPYLVFDRAIAVYNDSFNRHDPNVFRLFSFEIWKSPDQSVLNADEIYFRSPINLAGYKWFEPARNDRENEQRYETRDGTSGDDRSDMVSVAVAEGVMNLKALPYGIFLSTASIKPYAITEGIAYVRDINSLNEEMAFLYSLHEMQ